MPNDPILHTLGLARKAGKLEVGEEPVGAVCRARHARLVLLASDAAPNTRRRCAHFGEAGNVLWLDVPFTKEELGFCLGRSSCAMLALTDSGFAAAVVEKLALRDPEHYSSAAEQLRTKADRVLARQTEKRQHETNLQNGKKKPWAPPPVEKKDEKKQESRKFSRTHQSKPKPYGHGGSARTSANGGPKGRPGRFPKPGPGGRKLTGSFRRKP